MAEETSTDILVLCLSLMLDFGQFLALMIISKKLLETFHSLETVKFSAAAIT